MATISSPASFICNARTHKTHTYLPPQAEIESTAAGGPEMPAGGSDVNKTDAFLKYSETKWSGQNHRLRVGRLPVTSESGLLVSMG